MAQAIVTKEKDEFKAQKLFGGAFELILPERMIDLSNFRQIPDHQEVWTDASVDQSVIVEILERADTKDENAAKYHFMDISEANSSTDTKIKHQTQILTKEELPIAYVFCFLS